MKLIGSCVPSCRDRMNVYLRLLLTQPQTSEQRGCEMRKKLLMRAEWVNVRYWVYTQMFIDGYSDDRHIDTMKIVRLHTASNIDWKKNTFNASLDVFVVSNLTASHDKSREKSSRAKCLSTMIRHGSIRTFLIDKVNRQLKIHRLTCINPARWAWNPDRKCKLNRIEIVIR